jgi:hypothetical protein
MIVLVADHVQAFNLIFFPFEPWQNFKKQNSIRAAGLTMALGVVNSCNLGVLFMVIHEYESLNGEANMQNINKVG